MKYNYQQKDKLDQFYTKPTTASQILGLLDLSQYDLIIEPSAGDGSFYNQLKQYNTIAFDIDPKGDGIEKQDFLEYKYTGSYSRILCVGNPPFGKQGSMALKFICKCAEFADTIAFILPRSFKKPSMQAKVPKSYHLEKEVEFKECFLWKGEPYNVPSIFQIWVRKAEARALPSKVEPCGFEYVDKEKAHLAIRRVGFYAGRAYCDLTDKAIQSHYFIKVLNEDHIQGIMQHLTEYDKWEKDNTTGPRSISKQEINKVVNDYIASMT